MSFHKEKYNEDFEEQQDLIESVTPRSAFKKTFFKFLRDCLCNFV